MDYTLTSYNRERWRWWVHPFWYALLTNPEYQHNYYCTSKIDLYQSDMVRKEGRSQRISSKRPPTSSTLVAASNSLPHAVGPPAITRRAHTEHGTSHSQSNHYANGLEPRGRSAILGNGLGGECCLQCGTLFDAAEKRKLTDTCGHIKCWTCVSRAADGICPICARSGSPASQNSGTPPSPPPKPFTSVAAPPPQPHISQHRNMRGPTIVSVTGNVTPSPPVVTTRRAAAAAAHNRLQSATHTRTNSVNSMRPSSSSPGSSSTSNDACGRPNSSVYSDSTDSDSCLRFSSSVIGSGMESDGYHATIDFETMAELTSPSLVDTGFIGLPDFPVADSKSYSSIVNEESEFSKSLMSLRKQHHDNNNTDHASTKSGGGLVTRAQLKEMPREVRPSSSSSPTSKAASSSNKRRSRDGGSDAGGESVKIASGGGSPDITQGPPPSRSTRLSNKSATPPAKSLSPAPAVASTSRLGALLTRSKIKEKSEAGHNSSPPKVEVKVSPDPLALLPPSPPPPPALPSEVHSTRKSTENGAPALDVTTPPSQPIQSEETKEEEEEEDGNAEDDDDDAEDDDKADEEAGAGGDNEPVPKKKKKRSPVIIHAHITVLTGEPPMYQCNVCHKKFKTKAHIKYHEFCQKGDKPFKCEQCGQGFIAKSHYEYHLRTHTGERPYVCPKCGKGFNQRGKVTRHMRSHTGEKPFVCQECNRGFANAQALRSHHLIHTGERPFACTYCSKRFTGMTNLKKHVITHTGERPFSCNHCGKSFGLKWTLDLHLRTHSSERPYACDQCSRAFSNSKDLRRHLVIHSGERPFKCWICGTAFRRKDNLDRHIKNTHNQPKEVAKQLANEAAAEYLKQNAKNQSLGHIPVSKVNSVVISNIIKNADLMPPGGIVPNNLHSKNKATPPATVTSHGKVELKPTHVISVVRTTAPTTSTSATPSTSSTPSPSKTPPASVHPTTASPTTRRRVIITAPLSPPTTRASKSKEAHTKTDSKKRTSSSGPHTSPARKGTVKGKKDVARAEAKKKKKTIKKEDNGAAVVAVGTSPSSEVVDHVKEKKKKKKKAKKSKRNKHNSEGIEKEERVLSASSPPIHVDFQTSVPSPPIQAEFQVPPPIPKTVEEDPPADEDNGVEATSITSEPPIQSTRSSLQFWDDVERKPTLTLVTALSPVPEELSESTHLSCEASPPPCKEEDEATSSSHSASMAQVESRVECILPHDIEEEDDVLMDDDPETSVILPGNANTCHTNTIDIIMEKADEMSPLPDEPPKQLLEVEEDEVEEEGELTSPAPADEANDAPCSPPPVTMTESSPAQKEKSAEQPNTQLPPEISDFVLSALDKPMVRCDDDLESISSESLASAHSDIDESIEMCIETLEDACDKDVDHPESDKVEETVKVNHVDESDVEEKLQDSNLASEPLDKKQSPASLASAEDKEDGEIEESSMAPDSPERDQSPAMPSSPEKKDEEIEEKDTAAASPQSDQSPTVSSSLDKKDDEIEESSMAPVSPERDQSSALPSPSDRKDEEIEESNTAPGSPEGDQSSALLSPVAKEIDQEQSSPESVNQAVLDTVESLESQVEAIVECQEAKAEEMEVIAESQEAEAEKAAVITEHPETEGEEVDTIMEPTDAEAKGVGAIITHPEAEVEEVDMVIERPEDEADAVDVIIECPGAEAEEMTAIIESSETETEIDQEQSSSESVNQAVLDAMESLESQVESIVERQEDMAEEMEVTAVYQEAEVDQVGAIKEGQETAAEAMDSITDTAPDSPDRDQSLSMPSEKTAEEIEECNAGSDVTEEDHSSAKLSPVVKEAEANMVDAIVDRPGPDAAELDTSAEHPEVDSAEKVDAIVEREEVDEIIEHQDASAEEVDEITERQDTVAKEVDTILEREEVEDEEVDEIIEHQGASAEEVDEIIEHQGASAEEVDEIIEHQGASAEEVDTITERQCTAVTAVDTIPEREEMDEIIKHQADSAEKVDAIVEREEVDEIIEHQDASAEEVDTIVEREEVDETIERQETAAGEMDTTIVDREEAEVEEVGAITDHQLTEAAEVNAIVDRHEAEVEEVGATIGHRVNESEDVDGIMQHQDTEADEMEAIVEHQEAEEPDSSLTVDEDENETETTVPRSEKEVHLNREIEEEEDDDEDRLYVDEFYGAAKSPLTSVEESRENKSCSPTTTFMAEEEEEFSSKTSDLSDVASSPAPQVASRSPSPESPVCVVSSPVEEEVKQNSETVPDSPQTQVTTEPPLTGATQSSPVAASEKPEISIPLEISDFILSVLDKRSTDTTPGDLESISSGSLASPESDVEDSIKKCIQTLESDEEEEDEAPVAVAQPPQPNLPDLPSPVTTTTPTVEHKPVEEVVKRREEIKLFIPQVPALCSPALAAVSKAREPEPAITPQRTMQQPKVSPELTSRSTTASLLDTHTVENKVVPPSLTARPMSLEEIRRQNEITVKLCETHVPERKPSPTMVPQEEIPKEPPPLPQTPLPPPLPTVAKEVFLPSPAPAPQTMVRVNGMVSCIPPLPTKSNSLRSHEPNVVPHVTGGVAMKRPREEMFEAVPTRVQFLLPSTMTQPTMLHHVPEPQNSVQVGPEGGVAQAPPPQAYDPSLLYFIQPDGQQALEGNYQIVYAAAAATAERDEGVVDGPPSKVRLLYAEALGVGSGSQDGNELQFYYAAATPDQQVQHTSSTCPVQLMEPRRVTYSREANNATSDMLQYQVHASQPQQQVLNLSVTSASPVYYYSTTSTLAQPQQMQPLQPDQAQYSSTSTAKLVVANHQAYPSISTGTLPSHKSSSVQFTTQWGGVPQQNMEVQDLSSARRLELPVHTQRTNQISYAHVQSNDPAQYNLLEKARQMQHVFPHGALRHCNSTMSYHHHLSSAEQRGQHAGHFSPQQSASVTTNGMVPVGPGAQQRASSSYVGGAAPSMITNGRAPGHDLRLTGMSSDSSTSSSPALLNSVSGKPLSGLDLLTEASERINSLQYDAMCAERAAAAIAAVGEIARRNRMEMQQQAYNNSRQAMPTKDNHHHIAASLDDQSFLQHQRLAPNHHPPHQQSHAHHHLTEHAMGGVSAPPVEQRAGIRRGPRKYYLSRSANLQD